jgi:myo-inositol 2-dehydrogenase / D-chiro-inositol 1-dehydrogenase
MNSPLRVGIIGAGRIGTLHCENLATRIPGAAVAAIAEPDQERLRAIARRHGIPAAHTDYREILKDRSIDAVAVCSPTDLHAQMVREAAEAGKHIFCEKPIDLSLDRIRETLVAVDRAGVTLMVGFNRRFDANFMKVRELVRTGKIGSVHIVRITSRDPEPPPASYITVSGGLFLDMAIHDFDMARYLAGDEIEEVYARGAVLVDPVFRGAGDIDTAVTTLRFKGGALGTIDNSRKAVYGYDQRVEVFGSEGMAAATNNTPDTHTLIDHTGSHSALPLHFFMDRYVESYRTELAAFVEAVRNGTPPPVGGMDGLLSVAAGLAAKKSVAENRPVRVAELL